MRSWRRNPPGNEKADNAGILERMAEVFGMNIKMADVARYLGISKATVSLAVNGKPGVNEQTRNRILQCIEEMKMNDGKIREAAEPKPARSFQTIRCDLAASL